MKPSVRAFAFLGALVLSVFALQAQPPGWVYEGCWSPYPNCIGAKDVFHDANGYDWECGACGTTTQNPNPNGCYQAGGIHDEEIGYWCAPCEPDECPS